MKGKKNLEKAIVLGLLLSTSVYGTAWAEDEWSERNHSVDPYTGTLTFGTRLYIWLNPTYVDYNEYKNLKEYQKGDYEDNPVEINKIIINSNLTNGLTIYNSNVDLSYADIEVNVDGQEIPEHFNNTNGIELNGKDVGLTVKSYTANVTSVESDAVNLTEESYADENNISPYFNVINDFNAYVTQGSGIRVNASTLNTMSDKTSSVTVNGNTNITLDGGAVTTEKTLFAPGMQPSAKVTYNPAGVYAGNTTFNFNYNGGKGNITLLSDDTIPSDIIEMINNYGENIGINTYEKEVYGKTEVNLIGDVEILIGDNNYGIYAGKNGEINLSAGTNIEGKHNNLKITATGDNSVGLAAINGNLFDNGNITFIDKSTLWWFKVNGTIEKEVIDENLVLDTYANKYGSIITMNGESNIITMENGGKALYADAKNKAEGEEVIIQSGADGIGNLDVKGDIVATNSGKIDLQVNDWADITGDIEATNGGTIDFTLQPKAMMIVSDTDNNIIGNSGVSTLSLAENGGLAGGNVQAANGSTINLTFGDGAYFEGRVDDYKDADNTNWNTVHKLFDNAFVTENTDENGKMSSGTVNIELGNGAIWNVTEQSWVTNLSGNGTVVLVGEVNQNDENLESNIFTEGTGGYAVHIGKLEGNNTFVVNLNPNEEERDKSDMIYIYDGSSAGVQNLRINNEQEVLNALQNDGDRIRFATVAKTAATDGAGFGDDYVVRGRGVINSGFSIDYVDYKSDTDKGKYNGVAGAVKPGNEYIDNIYGAEGLDSQNLYLVRDSSKDEGLSDSGETIINMSRANYKNAIYMDRLNKRLGEARYINGEEEQGMWVRLRHDRIGQSGDFRSMNTMYELGYDVKQDCDNGERRVGFAVDYMRGSTTYSDIMGKGETKRYGLWLYDTWLGDKGHYADYVLKWGHLSNDFDIHDKDSFEHITGDYSNNVFSVSAEYGKKNDMGSGWYFEPQAQLQLARVTGANYVSSQDTKVSVDGINSLIGRAGFRLGRDLNESSTVYLKADLLHEFLGDQTITAQDATGTLREEFENKGTWYDVGIGFAAQTGKNSYAFLDVEKSFGNDNDETYQINAGMQWTF